MIDINIANVLTIAIVSVLGYGALQWLMNTFNINIPFLMAS